MLLGGVIGDAFGSAYEGSDAPVVDLNAQADVQITDDTQLTLATCEAIVECDGKIDPETIANRFAAWQRDRRVTRAGASTVKALIELEAGGHWGSVGARGERSAGNGAAMRISPLAFFLDATDRSTRNLIRDVCYLTHHNEEAYAGALMVLLAIQLAVADRAGFQDVLFPHIQAEVPDCATRDRLMELGQIAPEESLIEVAKKFGNSGYVVESVPFTLFAVRQLAGADMAGVVRAIIQCGGDTDTNASIAGQIAGALHGSDAVPENLLMSIPGIRRIQEAVEALASVADDQDAG